MFMAHAFNAASAMPIAKMKIILERQFLDLEESGRLQIPTWKSIMQLN